MRRAAILYLLLTLAAPWMARAEEVKPSHQQAAAELLEVMDSAQMVMRAAKRFAEDKLQANPLMEPYRDLLMTWIEMSLSWERLKPRMIDIYAEAFTEAELRELIVFYKTPIGRKALEKMSILTEKGSQAGQELIDENQAELQQMLAARQRELGVESPLDRANRLYDEAKWAEARDSYLLHLESNPGDLNARSDLGGCYKALGDLQQALAEFDRVIAADPGLWQALYNKIAVLGIDLDRKPEAKALLPALLKLQPDNAMVQELAASLETK